jgi:hypothetical protein
MDIGKRSEERRRESILEAQARVEERTGQLLRRECGQQ